VVFRIRGEGISVCQGRRIETSYQACSKSPGKCIHFAESDNISYGIEGFSVTSPPPHTHVPIIAVNVITRNRSSVRPRRRLIYSTKRFYGISRTIKIEKTKQTKNPSRYRRGTSNGARVIIVFVRFEHVPYAVELFANRVDHFGSCKPAAFFSIVVWISFERAILYVHTFS